MIWIILSIPQFWLKKNHLKINIIAAVFCRKLGCMWLWLFYSEMMCQKRFDIDHLLWFLVHRIYVERTPTKINKASILQLKKAITFSILYFLAFKSRPTLVLISLHTQILTHIRAVLALYLSPSPGLHPDQSRAGPTKGRRQLFPPCAWIQQALKKCKYI